MLPLQQMLPLQHPSIRFLMSRRDPGQRFAKAKVVPSSSNTLAYLLKRYDKICAGFQQSSVRSFASNSSRQRRPKIKVVRDRGKKQELNKKKTNMGETTQKEAVEGSTSRQEAYRKDKYTAIAQRAAPLIAMGVLLNTEKGSEIYYNYFCPLQIEQLWGPSMLPSIHPFGDIFLHTTPMWDSVRQWYHKLKGILLGKSSPMYTAGEIAIWKHPERGQRACKRIIGTEGDIVQRYGQFAEWFQHRDDLGIVWDSKAQTRGLDPSCPWDSQKPSSLDDDNTSIYRTLVVPEGHVWLEGDNPLLSVDSRHYGPIPIEWLQGRLIWRLYPLLRHPAIRKHDQLLLRHRTIRPKPLDLESPIQRGQEDRLALYYNLHRPKQEPLREPRPETPKANLLSEEQKEKFSAYRFD